MILAHGSGDASLESWTPVFVLLGGYALVVVLLTIFGRSNHPHSLAAFVLRAPDAIERLTKIPGWAGAAVGTALFGLLTAGYGFYSDVAWHIALGRDEELFTAPHTAIVVGLAVIFGGAVLGTLYATLQRVDTGFRVGPVRVPWSMLALGAFGGAALSGFPLDELWHRRYGIDVTMWSPTHMLMILGAALSPIASWLALAEAKVSPRDGRWARGVHVVAAWLVLQGLAAPLGEFVFGVPQFQQLFHPLVISIGAGFALVAMRIVHGPWWTIGIAASGFLLEIGELGGRDAGGLSLRPGALFVGSALAVEVVAWLLGTEPRRRFAIVSGVAVGTVGLATEWAWNTSAHQPWTSALLPDTVILSVIGASAAALCGAALGAAALRRRAGVGAAVLVLAGLVVVGTLAWPMPRRAGDVTADLSLQRLGGGEVLVTVTLDPPYAADGARWFQTMSWQGGDLHIAGMHETSRGVYVADGPMQVIGNAKTLVRLHRGAETMAVPVYMPADTEIDAPEVPAVDRTVAFQSEQRFLLREAIEGPKTFAYLIYALGALAVIGWAFAVWMAAARVSRPEPARVPAAVGS